MTRLFIWRHNHRDDPVRSRSAGGWAPTLTTAGLAFAIGLAAVLAGPAQAAPAAAKALPAKPAAGANAGQPGQPAAAGKRAEKDILTDLAAADKEIDGYLFEDIIQERLRPW